MTYALLALRAVSGLDASKRALAEAKIQHNRAHYDAGLGIVLEHARFTPEGAAIFAACQEAMDAVAA